MVKHYADKLQNASKHPVRANPAAYWLRCAGPFPAVRLSPMGGPFGRCLPLLQIQISPLPDRHTAVAGPHHHFIDEYTMLLEINPFNPQPRLVQQVVDKLKNGAVICYPTDTGYGIGCDIFNPKAIKWIMQLKNRPKHKPFSFMCSDLSDIATYAHVSNTAYRLLRKNLPGPYTFVLPGTKMVPKVMVTKQKTVGIRVPENPICRLLIGTLGHPIVNTSLPETEEPPLSLPFEIDLQFGNRLDLIIDGGPIFSNPSTVIDLTGDYPEVIREGQGDITPFL